MAGTETITLRLVAQDLMSGNVSKAIAGIDRLAKQGGIVGSVLQGVGQSMGQMLNPVALVAKGIGTVTDVMGDSISAASDQSEALSKVTVVFGKNAREIEDWARTASTAMGLSKTAALEAAGTLGNLFDGLGIAEDAGRDMSKAIVQLAADLGSFNNVATDEALVALQSGLLGEAEPMRRFGSALSAARVEAYGLENGLGELVKSGKSYKFVMSEADKVTARYRLILEDTKNAQGDFVRTSDGLANSTKTLNSQFEDMKAKVGAALQDAVTPMLRAIVALGDQTPNTSTTVGKLTQHYRDLIEQQKFANAEAQNQGDIFKDLYRFFAPQDAKIQDFTATLGWYGKMLGVTQHELALFTEAGLTFGDSLETIKGKLDQLAWDKFREGLSRWGKSAIEAGESAQAMGDNIEDAVRRTAKNVRGIAWNIPTGIVDAVKDGIPSVKSAMKDLTWAINHPMALVKTRAKIQARLTGDKIVEGLNSKNALIRQAAIDARSALLGQWNETGPGGGLPGRAFELGRLTIKQLIAGLNEGEQYALGLYGDPGTRSARLKLREKRHKHRAAGGPVTAGEAYIVGENRPELFVPDRNGTILPRVPRGGGTVVINLNGLVAAPSEAELDRIARVLAPGLQRVQARMGA